MDKGRSLDFTDWSAAFEQLDRWRITEPADEDGVPPTVTSACAARTLASRLQSDFPPPNNVAATGDGGVAFEWRGADFFISIEIDMNGNAEELVFERGRLTSRMPVQM